jgi:hypothetical protein
MPIFSLLHKTQASDIVILHPRTSVDGRGFF